VKRFIKACPLLSRINLEQNPVVCDIKDALITEEKSFKKSISILPQSSTDKSSESIQLYLDFLSNITSMFIKLRRVIEQFQIDPFYLLKSIHHQCQQYYEQNKIEIPEVILPMIEPESIVKYFKRRNSMNLFSSITRRATYYSITSALASTIN